MTVQPGNSWTSLAISAGIFLVVIALRWRRMRRERRLNIELLWIVPALLILGGAALFWSAPPSGLTWAIAVAALIGGGVLGWQRGRMMQLSVDPATQTVMQKGSPAALLFLLALIVIRAGARQAAAYSESWVHLGAMAVSDILIAFAIGLVTMTRVEMFLRARRLIEQTRQP